MIFQEEVLAVNLTDRGRETDPFTAITLEKVTISVVKPNTCT